MYVAVDTDPNVVKRLSKIATTATNNNDTPQIRVCSSLDSALPLLIGQRTVVIATEVVEHLDSPMHAVNVLCQLLSEVKPLMLIVTTPNQEFNVNYGMDKGEFRHADHKFECTEQEMQQIGGQVCIRVNSSNNDVRYEMKQHAIGDSVDGVYCILGLTFTLMQTS